MSIATFLLNIAGPLVMRVLVTLGMGTVTFTGVTAAMNTLIGEAQSTWSSLPTDVLAFASIAGVPQALGIICGAYTSRVAMWAAASATKWVTKAAT